LESAANTQPQSAACGPQSPQSEMQYDLVAVLPEVTPMAVVAEVSGAPHIGAVASPKEN